jgi:hypothetical protein
MFQAMLPYSVTQELMETAALFTVERQNSQVAQEQLDLAMAELDRYADELERVNQKRTDQGSAVHSPLGSCRVPERSKSDRQHNSI